MVIAESLFTVELLREIGLAIAGLVFGACIVAAIRYTKLGRASEDPERRGRYKLIVWMVCTVGAFALFQGVTRALLINSGAPADYRDWVAILLQINSLALLVTMVRRDKEQLK